jgi:ATP-dependent RNA helicase RhlE
LFDLDLHPSLARAVAQLGFTDPTPIQRAAIPPALAGRDVVASAATGTGKTAAFMLPIVQKLMPNPRGGTRALVLTPTRELAAQIDAHLRALAQYTRVRGAAVYGGVAMGPQQRAFRERVDVLVATPGRLLDHLERPYARLDALEVLVLDEADRMLDMGFIPAIRKILERVPKARQTLLFSATMPGEIAALVREVTRDPVTISLATGRAAPAAGVRQAAYPVAATGKTDLLLALLKDGSIRNALVFTRTKRRADRLAHSLGRAGVDAGLIHGGRSQAQRTHALAGFKCGRSRVLVATDVAARGIDVDRLSHVVNYDVPAAAEDYVHRVGRTARASETGDALTFVAPEEEGAFRAVERAIGTRVPRLRMDGAAAPEHTPRVEAAHAPAAPPRRPVHPTISKRRIPWDAKPRTSEAHAQPRTERTADGPTHRELRAARRKARPQAPWHRRARSHA